MYLNPAVLPNHLRQDYTTVANAYKKLLDDIQDYQTSLLPRYVSIPRYFEELGLTASYQDMLKLGEMALQQSRSNYKVGETALGQLRCFHEDILDKCFDLMTLEEDEAD